LGKYLCLRSNNLLAANSKIAIQSLVDEGESQEIYYHLKNVVNTDFYTIDKVSYKNVPQILCIGRISSEKRMDRAIKILSDLKRRGTEFTALIVGNGPLYERIKKEAFRAGLEEDRLMIKSAVDNPLKLYHSSDILLLTSDYEGVPNVIMEAASCGKPCVATCVGGVPEIVKHMETGILCPRENIDALAEALKVLIEDSSMRKRLGGNAASFVRRNHSLHILPGMLSELYSRVLK
jgi:glycosyltransferase involved in cell wall biosynthesis